MASLAGVNSPEVRVARDDQKRIQKTWLVVTRVEA